MSNHDAPTRWSEGVATGEHYLESTVRTASPARLRLMLIERAVEVSNALAENWRAKEEPGPNALSLKLLELLNELLQGVVGGTSAGEEEICGKVADLYVFLAKHLVAAEDQSDFAAIDEIRSVLIVEAETWRAVCAGETGGAQKTSIETAAAGGLDLQG